MGISLCPLRENLIENILTIIGRGECCALFGLSNTGKSPLLRTLAGPEYQAAYARRTGRSGALIYIDCNCVVELTAAGFYEIVVRTVLETLIDEVSSHLPALLQHLREQHTLITAAPSAFQASLAFNQAISECCRQLGRNLVLMFDEFDEVYATLEDRSLLNLRALRDKFADRLTYLTATVRPLAESRTPGDNEFAELFAAHTLALGLLSAVEARRVIEMQSEKALDTETRQMVELLAGGHLGLLGALIHATAHPPGNGRSQAEHLAGAPNARAECLKIWNQLRPTEQAALKLLITETQADLNPHDRFGLQKLGLLTADGQIFSDLFAAFVRRQCAAPAQNTVGIIVDEDAGEVWVDGVKITVLTELEYRLMRLLYQRQDRLTTKDMIVEAVWGTQYFDRVDDARVEKLVSRLRAKVESDPARPRYLLTQRGRGYKLSSYPIEVREENEEAGEG